MKLSDVVCLTTTTTTTGEVCENQPVEYENRLDILGSTSSIESERKRVSVQAKTPSLTNTQVDGDVFC